MDQMFPTGHLRHSNLKLSVDRKVPTILWANMEASNSKHGPPYHKPRSGNGIFPCGEMLFNAMKLNDWDSRALDGRVIVPIHTPINERAGKEIKQ